MTSTRSAQIFPRSRGHARARTTLTLAGLAAGCAAAAAAQDLTKVAFGTNWLAQAEHGGFYQSVADGTYEACGLEVEIVPGGPQVNNRALMLAGRIDFHMGGDMLQAFNAVKEGIPVVSVAAIFQKHPQVIIAHPGKAESFEDLKDLTLFIGDNGFASYYQWMIAAYGFTVEQRQPYTFNPAPFLADDMTGMQGYLSSEPYVIEKEGGFVPEVFLIADAGYSTYATTVETMAQTIEERPEVVTCFVEGSIKGWYNYLYGDNAAANALIIEANPDMTEDKIAFAIDKMLGEGIVDSGDAVEMGIGVLTEAKVEGLLRQDGRGRGDRGRDRLAGRLRRLLHRQGRGHGPQALATDPSCRPAAAGRPPVPREGHDRVARFLDPPRTLRARSRRRPARRGAAHRGGRQDLRARCRGARRHVADRGAGRLHLALGAIRLRQVHRAAADRGAEPAHGRADRLGRRAGAGRPWHRLPGADADALGDGRAERAGCPSGCAARPTARCATRCWRCCGWWGWTSSRTPIRASCRAA